MALTLQAWKMGFWHLSSRGAVGGGRRRPSVKMQLEPPVQATGENHPADLPGGESRGAKRNQNPTKLLSLQCPEEASHSWVPTRGPG